MKYKVYFDNLDGDIKKYLLDNLNATVERKPIVTGTNVILGYMHFVILNEQEIVFLKIKYPKIGVYEL